MKYPLTILSCLLFVTGSLFAHSANAQVNVVTKNITTNVTLVWEARSYVPPFYKGRALMPDGGDGRVVAFLPPEISSAGGANYVWRVDGIVDGAHSGAGRNIYEIRSDIFGGSPLIVVEVSDASGVIGTGALRIPLAKPRVLVYAEVPLGGVLFNNENPRSTGEELILETYPLFFTTTTRSNPALSYVWSVNRASVTNPFGNSGRLVLRSESDIGTTTIDVRVTNSERMLENTSGKATIFLK